MGVLSNILLIRIFRYQRTSRTRRSILFTAMYLYSQLPLQLLSALALAATVTNAQKPVTKSYCTTSFDTKSTNPVKSKTDYSTRSEKPTIFVTSTPSTTVTPLPSTETSVVATMTTITVTASQITVRCCRFCFYRLSLTLIRTPSRTFPRY